MSKLNKIISVFSFFGKFTLNKLYRLLPNGSPLKCTLGILSTNWSCKYCNKSTFDVDCEYLFGVDHIECALEHEQSNIAEPFKLMNQLSRMQDYITQLESRLNHLEDRHGYEEPTN